ncbi:colanic acid biosynthesis glycosyltransferase WcaL [Aliidongia dinghuensis]|uniref:Colanic acid biosynthesis glycosyltransferase WcaL n=1 Tax=Aliidongia dinghuensis TaxID=1867774 RepID=A0A8J2Z1E2_9PROT|nr:glycosyltransferase family 4 protein [Aliidongia dinghuensis]GGF51262.1 colanic acid biosynthesis glycosyltransferase WcaL [Aliidongia dinghuensis]
MRRIAVVVKGYPRLSETFIAQEIRALEEAGLTLDLVSLRRPTDSQVHPIHREIAASVNYLPEYLHEAPVRVWRAWRRVRRRPAYRATLALFLKDLRRDLTRNRVRRWGQALVLAAELPDATDLLYAHFLHTPASVARYAARLAGCQWAVSAHAKDIWTTPDWEKREKLADCAWATTCTAVGRDHLAALSPPGKPVLLGYHGLDFRRLPAAPDGAGAGDARNGGDPDRPVRLLSVGRAVAKKGYPDLLAALARLPAELHWRFTHIGGGKDAAALKAEATALGLADRIEWRGAAAQETVLAAYRSADLFVLASRIAADGDRDGLPNVLMEAQSQRLACLATEVAAIPELIETERTGLLVPPGDPAALAAALDRLIRHPALRERLAAAGHARVRERFGFKTTIDELAARLGGSHLGGSHLGGSQLDGSVANEAACASASTRR